MSKTQNLWRTDLDTYFYVKRCINLFLITPVFPFIFYCVWKHSPKSFGSLKYFLYFHVFCICLQWSYNCLLIDVYQFVPSPTVLIMGLPNRFIKSTWLYVFNYTCTSSTLGSCLTLFANRIFKIIALHRTWNKSAVYRILQFLIYSSLYLFATSVVPNVAFGLPDQVPAKNALTEIPYFHYPDILFQDNVVIFCDPRATCGNKHVKFNLIHITVVTFLIVFFGKFAFFLLTLSQRKLQNESPKTRRMHQNFNNRSILQALFQFLFSTVPFTIVNLFLYFNIVLPEMSYFSDIMAELMPVACVFALFVFYEPYQNYLLVVIRVKEDSPSRARISTTEVKSKVFKI